ncbi:MAG: DUF5683 domain-containing protein [Tenacibaculum sp.]
MLNKKIILVFFGFLLSYYLFAQNDTLIVKSDKKPVVIPTYNPLSPTKAAFYSAIFPGGGQIYNKKYWKVPIVWAALGSSMYYYITNSNEYDRFRTAFKLRRQGLRDEFTREDGTQIISVAGLENAQRILRKNRDLSLLTGVLLYILQIVEASVNAHLLQFETDNSLSIKPKLFNNSTIARSSQLGFSLKYSF